MAALDTAWDACIEASGDFPASGSSQYDVVKGEAIDNARYRYGLDAP